MSLTLRKELEAQAELGNAQACLNLFEEYQNESGQQAATDWLDEALDSNYASAQYIAGIMELNRGEIEEGIHYLEMASANEDPQAMLVLGQFFLGNILNLEKVHLDVEKGITYLTTAAQKGLAQAALLLGKCYYTGTWVASNRLLGVLWLEKAQDLGSQEASRILDEVVYASIQGVLQ